MFTGEHLDARTALEIGLVNRVVPAAELQDVVQQLAFKIAGHSRMAVQGTKVAINALLRDAANAVLETSLAIERRTLDTPEHQAAVGKFLAMQRR